MLRPCPACARHVRDATCPFCGAAVPSAALGVFAGPLTRAAVFSALAGCWTGSAPADHTTTVDHKTDTHEQHTPPPPLAAGTVEGTVTDSNTGSAAGFAQVELLGTQGAVVGSTTTDASGHYRFEGIAPGAYTVRVFVRANNPRQGGGTAEQPIEVRDQGVRADVAVAVPVYHYNPNQTPMPYGAPPARRRIV